MIYDSKDDPQEQEVSAGIDNASDDNRSNDGSNDNVSKEEDKEIEADVFFHDTRSIMNWTSQKVGMAAMEDCLSVTSLACRRISSTCCGTCWGRAACTLRSASPSICFALSII
jgi:hypothetical protein